MAAPRLLARMAREKEARDLEEIERKAAIFAEREHDTARIEELKKLNPDILNKILDASERRINTLWQNIRQTERFNEVDEIAFAELEAERKRIKLVQRAIIEF